MEKGRQTGSQSVKSQRSDTTMGQIVASRSKYTEWEHRSNEVWVESCNSLQHEKGRELRNKYVIGAEKALDHTLKTLDQRRQAVVECKAESNG